MDSANWIDKEPVGSSARPADGSRQIRARRLRKALYAAAAVFCATPWASPPVALALGIGLALALENPFPQLGKQISKRLLQTCVVLLGFGMNLSAVLRAGERGMLFAAASIAATFLLGWLLGRWLQIDRTISTLIATGTAICGGSAIAAVGSVLGAAEGEMTVAMGTVFTFNAVALYLFPLLGHALGLTQSQFGVWAGVAIHDTSSVVGAAAHYGLDALQTATAVKLSRVLWIIPVALFLALSPRSRPSPEAVRPGKTTGRARIEVPWFVGLFLLASVVRTSVPGMAEVGVTLANVAKLGFALTLFLIGAGLSRKTLRAVGWKPMAQGLLLWLFIGTVSLLVILAKLG